MVKGVTRRVVVVRCPDTRYFDEAIFMVREDVLCGMEPERVLKEACRAADSYIRLHGEKRKLHRWWLVGGGAALLGAVLLLVFV